MILNKRVFALLFVGASILFTTSGASAAGEKVFKCVLPKKQDVSKLIISKLSENFALICPTCTSPKFRVSLKPAKTTGLGLTNEGIAGVSLPADGGPIVPEMTDSFAVSPTQCTQVVKVRITLSYKDAAGAKKTSSLDKDIHINGVGL